MALSKIDGTNFIEGTVPSTVAPGAGKVLQVSDMVSIATDQTLATSTYTDLTGLSINITPSSTSSKILMNAYINCRYNDVNGGYGLKFFRDSTNIFTTTTLYSTFIDTSTADFRFINPHQYIDSPSSTSEITYKIQVGTYLGTTCRFNNSAQSTFYLMEIAG